MKPLRLSSWTKIPHAFKFKMTMMMFTFPMRMMIRWKKKIVLINKRMIMGWRRMLAVQKNIIWKKMMNTTSEILNKRNNMKFFSQIWSHPATMLMTTLNIPCLWVKEFKIYNPEIVKRIRDLWMKVGILLNFLIKRKKSRRMWIRLLKKKLTNFMKNLKRKL